MLTQAELKDVLSYDPMTGKFIWIKGNPRGGRQIAGSEAGSLCVDGYIEIKVKGQRYRAHRLAWFYVYGIWPKKLLDHANTIRNDNRLQNLREATHVQNLANSRRRQNNTSGFKGVNFHKKTRKWWAAIMVDGKREYLGLFLTPGEAHLAYCKAALKLSGKFARSG